MQLVRAIMTVLMLLSAAVSYAQPSTVTAAPTYGTITFPSIVSGSATASNIVNLLGSGVSMHKFSYQPFGTVSAGAVTLQGCTANDVATCTTLIGATTVTSGGTSALTTAVVNYVRFVVSTPITGGGSVYMRYYGYVDSVVSSGGGATPGGGGADTYVTYWTSATAINGDSGFLYNKTNTAPQVSLVETGGGTNQTWWALKADAGVFTISTLTDAGAAGTSPLTLTRTGVGVATSLAGTPQAAAAASIAGSPLTLAASSAVAGTSVAGAASGGSVTITAGDGGRFTSGNGAGGDIFAVSGGMVGSAREGQVVVGTTTTSGIYSTNGLSTSTSGKAFIAVSGTGQGIPASIVSFRYSDNTTTRPAGVSAYKSRDTAIGSLTASASGELLAVYVGRGAGSGTVWDTTDAGIAIISSQTHTSANQGKYVQVRVTADNATAQTNSWRFAQDASLIPEADNTQAFGTSTARIATANITGITVQTVAMSSGITGNVVFKGGTPVVTGDGTLQVGSQNLAGRVDSTVTAAASIVVTFSSGYTVKPVCMAVNETTTANAVLATESTTAVTLTGTTVTGDDIAYTCIGY